MGRMTKMSARMCVTCARCQNRVVSEKHNMDELQAALDDSPRFDRCPSLLTERSLSLLSPSRRRLPSRSRERLRSPFTCRFPFRSLDLLRSLRLSRSRSRILSLDRDLDLRTRSSRSYRWSLSPLLSLPRLSLLFPSAEDSRGLPLVSVGWELRSHMAALSVRLTRFAGGLAMLSGCFLDD